MSDHPNPNPLYCWLENPSEGRQQQTVNQKPQPEPQAQLPLPEGSVQKPSRLFEYLFLLLGGAFLSVTILFCIERFTGKCPFTYEFEQTPNPPPPSQPMPPIQESVFPPTEEVEPLVELDEFDTDIEDEYLSPDQCAELETPELYEEDTPNGD